MNSVDADVPEVLVTEESFEVFYEREFHQVVALAFVMCGSWSAAEASALFRQSRERWTDPVSLDDGDSEFWNSVRSLPARQRQVISLHYVNSLSVKEIAGTLALSEATVKTHLQRGRRSLELKLTERSEQS